MIKAVGAIGLRSLTRVRASPPGTSFVERPGAPRSEEREGSRGQGSSSWSLQREALRERQPLYNGSAKTASSWGGHPLAFKEPVPGPAPFKFPLGRGMAQEEGG